ncbi:MAG: cell division protein ZapA [Bacillota bacterium]
MGKEDKPKKKYIVNILGEEFTITGNLNQKYVNMLQDLINSIGSDISSAYPHLPRRRLWGLTLINLADRYFKLEQKQEDKMKKNRELKHENEKLRQKITSLEEEYEELSQLLEEVDG